MMMMMMTGWDGPGLQKAPMYSVVSELVAISLTKILVKIHHLRPNFCSENIKTP